MARTAVLIAAFAAAFFTPAAADEFTIDGPESVANMTFACWSEKKATSAFNAANFDAVLQGLLVQKTSADRPLMTVWLHHLSGRASVVISHPNGDECIVLVAADVQ